MKISEFLAGAILFLAVSVFAQAPSRPLEPSNPDPEKAGQALAEKLRSAAPTEDAEFSGLLKVRRRDGSTNSIPVTCRLRAGKTSWQVIYETGSAGQTAAEKLVIVHTADQPNEYLRAQALSPGEAPGELVRLAPGQIATPLAGTDFWLMDLGLEFFHWPKQRILKHEMRRGRPCDVLESIDPSLSHKGYARVMSWLDKETGGPILAEAYDSENKLVKEFSIRSVYKKGQLREMVITDVKKRSRTRLEFELEPR